MNYNRRLFREKAVASKWQGEKLDDMLRVTAPHEWAIVVGLALMLLGIVVWGLFGSIERSLAADCVLVRPGERHAVVSGVAGTVVDVLVSTGDRVKSGQAIARVRLPEVDRQVRIARAKVGLLETQLAGSATASMHETLRAARDELLELEAVAAAGGRIVSPYAGEVAVLGLVAGQAVAASAEVAQIRQGDAHRLQAIAIVEPDQAQRVKTGMAARILLNTDRDTSALEATVREVSPHQAAVPGWLTALGLPARGQLIRLDLREPPPLAATDGQRGRFLLVTERHAPVFLLVPARSG